MSIAELQLSIAQLRPNEKAELLRFLTRELRQTSAQRATAVTTATDRKQWLQKLARLRQLTASESLRPSQEILDELREDRI